MEGYPQRTAVPKSKQGEAKVRAKAAYECVKIQCGRNGMPLLTDPVQHPKRYPTDSEAKNEAAKMV
ncbi:Uncharacterised protein [uncultured archaeon]|nr:Uncharacterised protein [uncultured archaeon]